MDSLQKKKARQLRYKQKKEDQGFKYLQIWVNEDNFNKLKDLQIILSRPGSSFMQECIEAYQMYCKYDPGDNKTISISEEINDIDPKYHEISKIHLRLAWILNNRYAWKEFLIDPSESLVPDAEVLEKLRKNMVFEACIIQNESLREISKELLNRFDFRETVDNKEFILSNLQLIKSIYDTVFKALNQSRFFERKYAVNDIEEYVEIMIKNLVKLNHSRTLKNLLEIYTFLIFCEANQIANKSL